MKMKLAWMLGMTALLAHADVTYLSTTKSAGGGMVTTSKFQLKGNKIKMDTDSMVTIMDFDAQTMTTLDPKTKTYRVTSMNEIAQGMDKASPSIQAKATETGAKKTINGFNCRQVNLTMNVQTGAPGTGAPGAMAMVMDMESWVSADVPGAAELAAFGKRMAEKGLFPGATGDPRTRKAMLDLQREMAKINGVPVQQVMRMRMADDAQNAQMAAQMQQARAQMEALRKQGGPAAAQIEKALAAMGGGGKSLMETVTDSTGFSTAAIPATDFAVPAGYRQTK
jgi:hypothetical protein